MRSAVIAVIAALALTAFSRAQVTVWVDFTSDIHDAFGHGLNGTADWIDELDKAAGLAGVTTFSMGEREDIQDEIMSQLASMYSVYDVTFTTSMPGSGAFDAIAFGKTSFGFGSLGIAPNDPANIASGQVAGVATGNFGFILDEYDGVDFRSSQMIEISTALAGTGAHELGHTFGLNHHHVYSDSSITPTALMPLTYAPTGGVQNSYIMATGSTGLSEVGREMLREFSPWEKAMLDFAGGATAGYPTLDNQKLVTTPVPLVLLEEGPIDAGSTPMTALPLSLGLGEKSGMKLGMISGDLDGTPTDMDMYRLVVPEPSLLSAELFSDNRFDSPFDFDTILLLMDAGGAMMTMNDDVMHSSDAYNAATFQQDDSYLLNIPLAPGLYHFMIHASPSSSIPPGPGDTYWFAYGLAPVPEPGSLALVGLVALLGLRRRVVK